MIEGPDHALYGTSAEGGGRRGLGGPFRLGLDGTYGQLGAYNAPYGSSDITPAIDSDGHVIVSTTLGYIRRYESTGREAGVVQLPSGSRAYLTSSGIRGVLGVETDGGDAAGDGYVFPLEWH